MSGWCPDCLCAQGLCDVPEERTATISANLLREQGRREERAAIVAWLRKWAETIPDTFPAAAIAIVNAWDAIERGEHEHE